MHTFAIFELGIGGHYLEWLHHIYIHAGINDKSNKYIFFIQEVEFSLLKNKYNWPEYENVEFSYITEDEISQINKGKNKAIKAYNRVILLRKKIISNNITDLFLLTIETYMPFLPLLIPNRIKIHGIIYYMFLYDLTNMGLAKKSYYLINYFLYARLSIFKRILILNDSSSACYLNRKFHANKFIPLPDPFETSFLSSTIENENNFGIGETEVVFLHFGGLTSRKGTLQILKAIESCSKQALGNKCFVFAGYIYSDIKEEFYAIYDRIKDKAHIVIINEFCDYQTLTTLCKLSSYILIPYQNTSMSSGILGYASYYNKDVFAPSKGLLGKLVHRYKLGTTYNKYSDVIIQIADFIKSHKEKPIHKSMESKYCEINTIHNFVSTLISSK